MAAIHGFAAPDGTMPNDAVTDAKADSADSDVLNEGGGHECCGPVIGCDASGGDPSDCGMEDDDAQEADVVDADSHNAAPDVATDTGPDGDINCGQPVPSSKIVLFGGDNQGTSMLADSWEWDGSRWFERTPQTHPPGRWAASGASWCGGAVIFGGSASNRPPYFDDQWIWDGTNWRSVGTVPFAITSTSAAALSGTIVQFGGLINASSTDATWVWNGVNWSMPQPSLRPTARQLPMIAKFGSDILLFGGLDDSNTLPADTWLWDGTAWIEMHPSTSPTGRWGAVGVELGTTVMMFGGIDANSDAVADTWLWDGTNWSQPQMLTSAPPARSQAAAAALGKHVILSGGQDNAGVPIYDTYDWDGTKWTQLQVPSPTARYGSIMIAF